NEFVDESISNSSKIPVHGRAAGLNYGAAEHHSREQEPAALGLADTAECYQKTVPNIVARVVDALAHTDNPRTSSGAGPDPTSS
ncbi:hypothetical protein OSTOST_02449, partial [Ostertagia ostertagi]